jgi:acetyl-CoA carboxylase biotin carboxyl carrier protein
MSSINQEDIFLILKLLEESPFDELQLETGDIKLQARKKGISRAAEKAARDDHQSPRGSGLEPAATREAEKARPDPPAPGRDPVPSAGAANRPGEKPEEGVVEVKAPMLGTFYRTPKPGSPPFVEVGAMVKEEDPVCIIEVMKLFNTVRAGVQGRIVRVCAEQGQLVEYQQPLFLVEKGTV